uniref:Nucleolar protein 58/56 N-terminal domain-containing protein n=1 Tax=Oryza meridionalis TaxID=40149 RepID=A0A0E0CL07_9ORYZ
MIHPFAASGHYSLRQRDRRAPPSRNPRKRPRISIENDVIGDIDARLGNGGAILLLFETPSGFAIFSFDGIRLIAPTAMEDIWQNFAMEYRAKFVVWRLAFQVFTDKSLAINFDTGVDDQLTLMITKYHRKGGKIAVGKPEYKTIIEANLDIWQNFAMEYRAKFVVWRLAFQVFTDKSLAINFDTGVDDQLTLMITKYHRKGGKIAVGKPEYKTIIEANLGISCLYDEFVMEVMWGLKNLMHSLVPEENSQLSKEDRLQMSQGLKMLLNRYGFDVKPGMVNKRILEAASDLYDCDDCEKKNNWSLRRAGRNLMDISSINSEDWGLLKLSTALMIVCYPKEKIIACLLKHSTDLLIASYPRREVIECSQEDRKGLFPPQKLAIDLSFHNQYGTIQQSPLSHIGKGISHPKS